MPELATEVLDAINQKLKDSQEDGFRNHLGGSLIGRKCERELWYTHRWATSRSFSGQMLRLFARGHLEEFRFVEWLRNIGCLVYEYDPKTIFELLYNPESDSYHLLCEATTTTEQTFSAYENCDPVSGYPVHVAAAKEQGIIIPTPKQFRVESENKHFGGSLDGIALNVPGVERFGLTSSDRILLEFKTHGSTSYKKLVSKGLIETKWEHFVQMQVYMQYYNIKLALYMAIDKNTDNMYVLFVEYNKDVADKYWERGRCIVQTDRHPKRITKLASDNRCRFCDHKRTCHLGHKMYITCRSCSYSRPVNNGEWHCNRWDAVIPFKEQGLACKNYIAIKD